MNEHDQSYPPAVQQLLTLGRPVGYEPADWARSVVAGLAREHVPDLVRMLDDPSLNNEEVVEPQYYAPVHAWRALGHFKAPEAVDALVHCLQVRQRREEFDDWSLEEIPKVLAAIGPDAVSGMVRAVSDPATERYASSAIAEALAAIGAGHPGQRKHVVARLMQVGERFADRPREANDGLVMALLDLKAMEAVPLLRRIFHAKAVNADMVGDWGEVRRDLNLERQPDDPPERRPGESVHGPDSLVGTLARQFGMEEHWKSPADGPSSPAADADSPVKHTAKWHRKQAKKRKQQTRRC